MLFNMGFYLGEVGVQHEFLLGEAYVVQHEFLLGEAYVVQHEFLLGGSGCC